MSIKGVVKVMNFHSLLRVDKSRDKATKYQAVEAALTDMIDNIVNNRNVVLDVATLKVKPDKPELYIYIGSDMGFCNNLNSLVRKQLEQQKEHAKQIIIGRKLRPAVNENTILFQNQDEYMTDSSQVMEILDGAIRNLSYSRIMIVYNHYYNSSEVDLVEKQIFPVKAMEKKEGYRKIDRSKLYKEDFVCEGEFDKLLVDLVTMYLKYSMEISAAMSYAAENIARQNVTTESMKRIDEREEMRKQKERRIDKDKQFAKVLDNFTKLSQY